MSRQHLFIKDGFLTITVVFIFCLLFVVANANQHAKEVPLQAQLVAPVMKTRVPSKLTEPAYQVRVPQTVQASSTKTIENDEAAFEKQKVEPISPEENTPVTPLPKSVTVDTKPETTLKPITTQMDTDTSSSDSFYMQTLRDIIEKKTNALREDEDLYSLRRESTLEKNARAYSLTMLTSRFLSHTDQTGCDLSCRFKADGYGARAFGENLAMLEFDEKPSAEAVALYFVREWQKSAGHRKNLLSSTFTHQGVGIALDRNSIYVTVHFAEQN